MTTKDILIKAKRLIDSPEKWRKDALDLRRGVCCIAQAIARQPEAKDGGVFSQAAKKTFQALGFSSDWRDAAKFNDSPDTTHLDIMNLFNKAIERAE